MLRVYISHAPADKPQLLKLLQWLKPLEEQYYLRLFYNKPAPEAGLPYHWDAMLDQLAEAHIFLFLISPNSLKTAYIEQEEVPRALARQAELGSQLVRICPVVLSAAPWEKQSRLGGQPALGGPNAMNHPDHPTTNFLPVAQSLRNVIEELRRNWLEEYYRTGMPTDDFFQPASMRKPTPGLQPLPGWVGVVMVMTILYMVTSWYFSACAPRMYHRYVPKSLPYEAPPERYLRDNPVLPPEPAPLRMEEDSVGVDGRR